MRGYPKTMQTKQDFLNLLDIPEFKDQALADLKIIFEIPDQKVKRVISGSEETKDLVSEEIDNPFPLWKHKGFESRKEVGDLIVAEKGGKLCRTAKSQKMSQTVL